MSKLAGFAPLAVLLASTLAAQPSLKDAYKPYFKIGAAVGGAIYAGSDAAGAALVKQQFNSVTPENDMKWERIHPAPGKYNFEPADKYVEFGEKNGMWIIGHCLIWHSQTPKWVFEDENGK